MHVGYEMVDSQRGAIIMLYPTSEWNNCFIKTARHKISRNVPDFICETGDFQLVFNFEQTRSATVFGEHGIMAHIP